MQSSTYNTVISEHASEEAAVFDEFRFPDFPAVFFFVAFASEEDSDQRVVIHPIVVLTAAAERGSDFLTQ